MTYLVDTNVLVYACDAGDPVRSAKASAWLDALIERRAGAISVQALSEYVNVVVRRMQPAWSTSDASATLLDLARVFDVIPVTPLVMAEALRGVGQQGLSYCDAQMWAVAQLHQVPYLLTEDMASGATVDPFTTEPTSG